MYRMLFLALKKVQMVKITSRQISNTQQKNPPTKFPIAATGEFRENCLTLPLYLSICFFFHHAKVFDKNS